MNCVFMEVCILTTVFTLSTASTPLAPCRLGQDLLNGLVNHYNRDEEAYGIENAFGLIGNDPGNLTDKHNLTSKELEDCIQHYLEAGPSKVNTTHGAPSFNLHYDKPAYLGSQPQIPVPVVPDDENYLPGEEGYTTYINSHNFPFKEDKNYKTDDTYYEELVAELIDILEEWL